MTASQHGHPPGLGFFFSTLTVTSLPLFQLTPEAARGQGGQTARIAARKWHLNAPARCFQLAPEAAGGDSGSSTRRRGRQARLMGSTR